MLDEWTGDAALDPAGLVAACGARAHARENAGALPLLTRSDGRLWLRVPPARGHHKA